MRLFYPNITRPKKASKCLTELLSLSLATAQNAVSKVCGYQNWFDLAHNCITQPPTKLDQALSEIDYVRRQAELSLALAAALNIPDGDAQFALARSRLTGDRSSLSDQIRIRLECFRRTKIPPKPRRTRGAIGILRAKGWKQEPVILRNFGRPTSVIAHRNVTTLADFEYISPKRPPDLFLPGRLYLPYGWWTEADSAKVIFSRDYFPLWRLREQEKPQRLDPWLRIRFVKQDWFWDDGELQLGSLALRERMTDVLEDFAIRELPILADALPLILHNDEIDSFADAKGPLRRSRTGLIAA
jgi:hypothetical protein